MDLNAPLGMKPPPRRGRVAPVVAALVLALALGGLGAYLLQADPHGGEPYATAAIPPAPALAPTSRPAPLSPDPMPTGSIAGANARTGDTMRMENGVKVVSPDMADRIPESRTGPLVIDVSKALDRNARQTASAEGLPRTNAAPPNRAAMPRPRIAIFVSGLGLDPAATRTAIESMPANVSFAFVPSNMTVLASIDAAKARGHEILLQLPMQNAGDATSGLHTLRADESPPEITRDMAWLMARFQGYVGVANLLGAPVTASQPAMTAILRSVGQRGLFYLDDGTSRRSLGPSVAASLGVASVQADVVIDATADPDVVRANLERLAALARRKGIAIGMASGLPDHLPAIARFAADLDAQGLTLVPVSVIANGGASLATAR